MKEGEGLHYEPCNYCSIFNPLLHNCNLSKEEIKNPNEPRECVFFDKFEKKDKKPPRRRKENEIKGEILRK